MLASIGLSQALPVTSYVILGKTLHSVCLISPACNVGVTIVSTYLPHRGVVRIHVVTFGALNRKEEV